MKVYKAGFARRIKKYFPIYCTMLSSLAILISIALSIITGNFESYAEILMDGLLCLIMVLLTLSSLKLNCGSIKNWWALFKGTWVDVDYRKIDSKSEEVEEHVKQNVLLHYDYILRVWLEKRGKKNFYVDDRTVVFRHKKDVVWFKLAF